MLRTLLISFALVFMSMIAQAGDIAPQITNTDSGEPADCPAGVNNQSPQGPDNPQAGPHRGNPIHVGTGNKFHKETLYQGIGEFPLGYSLYYNSRHIRPDGVTGRWTASYSQYVYYDPKKLNSGESVKISLFREDGQQIVFSPGTPTFPAQATASHLIGKGKSVFDDGRISYSPSTSQFQVGDYINLTDFRVSLIKTGNVVNPSADLSGPHEVTGFSSGFIHVRPLTKTWPSLAGYSVVTDHDSAKFNSATRGSAATGSNQFKSTGSLSYVINRFGAGTTANPYVTFFRDYKYTRPDGFLETYDHRGLLTTIESPLGLKHSISRSFRQYATEFQPYRGPALCKEGNYYNGTIKWVTVDGRAESGSGTVKFSNSGGGETASTGSSFQCTDPNGPTYINWTCKINSATSPGFYKCATFAHIDAACLSWSSNIILGTRTCESYESIIEGDEGVRFDMDVTVTDSYGSALSWTEVGSKAHSVGGVCDGCSSTLTTPAGAFVFERTSDGLIKAITNPGSLNGKKQFVYEINQSTFSGGCSVYWKCQTALTGIIDEEGSRFATWEYLNYTQSTINSNVHMARAFKSYHGVGSEVDDYSEIEYTDGHTRKVTNRQGHSQILNFTASDGFIKLDSVSGGGGTNCKNTSASYSYNANKQIQKIAYEGGKFTLDYTYYSSGRIESITEAKGSDLERKAVYVWDANVKRGLKSIKLYEKTKEMQLVEFFYWPNGRLKERTITDLTVYTIPYATNGRKLTTTYTYDYWSGSKVKTLTIDGPRQDLQDSTVLSYNDKGQLSSAQNAAGQKVAFSNFNAAGLPGKIVDQNNVTTEVAFNYRNQLQTILIGDTLYYLTYFKNGLLKRIVYTGGGAFNFEYTSARKLKVVQDELGNRMEFARTIDPTDPSLLNVVTLIKTVLGEERYAEKQQLDALGRVYKWFGENKNVYVDRFDYDTVGNLTGINNGGVYSVTASIDRLGRFETITSSDGGLTTLKYNALDEITSVKDPRQLTTSYTVDGFGRVIQQLSPDTGKTIYHYDAAGNITRKVDNANKQTDFSYDSLNRLTNISFAASQGQSIAYRYDDTSSGNYGKGRLTSASVGGGRSAYWYTYNQKGLIDQKTTITGSAIYIWRYGYDAMGRLTSLQYPSGRLLTYSLDVMGKITQVVSTYAGVDEPIAQTMEYEPFGPLKSFYYGNGVKHVTTYSKAYWPVAIENTSVQKDNLGYYNTGLLRQTDVQYGAADDMWYYFDDGARLENIVATAWNTEFQYDLTGNRDKKVSNDSGAGTTRTLDTVIDPISNRIKGVVGVGQSDWQYTLTGQLSGKPPSNEVFIYGDNDRLKNYQGPAGNAEYEYGPFGERTLKKATSDNVAETHYAYEGPTLLAEFDGAGKVLREYFYAGGHLIGMYELTDKDGDKMDDGWEKAAFGGLSHGVNTDSDGDGVTDSEEFQAGLDPLNPNVDSDGDGMPDDWERYYFGALNRDGSGDFDRDGATDLAEYQRGTRPNFNDIAWLIPILNLLMR